MKKLLLIIIVFFLLLSSVVAAPYEPYIQYLSYDTVDLIAGLPQDLSNNNYNITSVNGASTNSSGYLLQAYNYDGTNDYLETNPTNTTNANQKTYNAFVNIHKCPPGEGTIIAVGGPGSEETAWIGINSACQAYVAIQDGGATQARITGGRTLNIGQWYMITGVVNGSGVSGLDLYVDGLKENETAGPSNSPGTNINFDYIEIGRNNEKGGLYFNGSIDESAIFNYALDNSTVVSLYNYYLTGATPFKPLPGQFNYSTVSVVDYDFSTPVVVTGSYGTVASVSAVSENNSVPHYVHAILHINSTSSSTTGSCRVDVNGTKYATTTRTITGGTQGNMALITSPFNMSNNTVVSVECRKTGGGGNYIIQRSEMAIVHFYDKNDNTEIPNTFFNATGLPVTTSDGIIQSFSYTTSDFFINGSLVIDGRATYTYGSTNNMSVWFVNQNTSETCGNYTRFGTAGSSGSVGTTCVFKDILPNTTYNFSFYGVTSNGTGTLNELRMHLYELDTNYTATNNTDIDGVVLSAGVLSKVSDVKIENYASTTFNTFVGAGIGVLGSSQDAYFFLNNSNGDVDPFYRTLSSTGLANINLLEVFEQSGVSNVTYELWGYCPSGCTVQNGELSAFVTDIEPAIAQEFNISVFDYWNNNTITNFSVVINGVTIINNDSVATIPVNQELLNFTIVQSDYFNRTFFNWNTSLNLNASMKQSEISFNASELYTNVSVSGVTVTVNGNTSNPKYMTAGNYNGTCSAPGYFDVSVSFSVSALDNKTVTCTGMSDTLLNITAITAINGSTINSFSGYAYNDDLGINVSITTNNGFYEASVLTGNYTIFLTALDHASKYFNVTVDDMVENVTVPMYTNNSLNVSLFDIVNLTVINGINANVTFEGSTVTYTRSTSTGLLYIDYMNDDTYTVTVSASGYNPSVLYVTVGPNTHNDLNFYLSSTLSEVDFIVKGNDPVAATDLIENATLTFSQNINGTVIVVAQGTTDFSGRASIYLDPSIKYTITVEADGFNSFTGSVTPTQSEYSVTLTRTITGFIDSQFNYLVLNNPLFSYDNATKKATTNFTISSSIGDLSYFGIIVYYNGTSYTTNISSSSSGGTPSITFDADHDVNSTVNVTYFYKRLSDDEQSWNEVYYLSGVTSASTSLPGLIQELTGAGGAIKGLVGAFIVVLFVVLFSLTRSLSVITIGALVGVFINYQYGLWPNTLSLISLVVGIILLISDSIGGRG